MGQHPDLWPNEGGNIGQNHVFRKLEDDTVVDRWGSSWEDKWFLITEDGMLANKEYDGTGPSSFESLGCDEAEELSTTESKSAICPFCEAKSVSNVERHCFNCHCRHCRGGHLRRYIRRVAVGVGDLAIVVAGGLATVVILNFNQSLGEFHGLVWPSVVDTKHVLTNSHRNMPGDSRRPPLADGASAVETPNPESPMPQLVAVCGLNTHILGSRCLSSGTGAKILD